MILGVYAGLARGAAPWLRRLLRRRAARGKEIPSRLAEREGIAALERPAGVLVWVHAASVGEMMSAVPLIEHLAARGAVLLTTGTVTSARLAAARLPKAVLHQFLPLDVPAWVARFLAHWRPDVAVFMESELWPNLLAAVDQRGIRRFLVNGRMSAASARHWRYVPAVARRLLGGFAAVHAQSAGDAAQFRALGAANVLEWGNLKFAAATLPADEQEVAVLAKMLPGPVWLAASTHPGEEEIIWGVHQALVGAWPELVTIIVPRHPERGKEVAALCADAPRRSVGQSPCAGRVYVADTLGELGLFCRVAAFVFMGNSLVGFGGHNLIEPARLGKAVICGPHLENFVEAAMQLRAAQALVEVETEQDLVHAVQDWVLAPAVAKAAGLRAQSAFRVVEKVPERLTDLILGAVA